MTFYGIPLNILRDVYVTGRSLVTRLRSLHRYQTATRNMDQRYPNATQEEMAAMSDHTCIICREEMVLPRPPEDPAAAPAHVDGPNTTPKKLPCGHIFHFNCLRSWLERQQSCPTCRRNVLETAPQPAAAGAQPQNAAAPQAQNPPGQGAQNPGLNNPLGLMGRLFAPPGQADPGQAVPAQNINIAPNQVNAGGQPIVIEYHIQYQAPRQPAQQPLQPAPQFQGFQGPAGVWQPWPQAPENPAVVDPAPTPVLAAGERQQEVQGTPTTEASTSVPPVTNPREAAALAALRRNNIGRSTESPTPTTPSSTPTSQSMEPSPPSASTSQSTSSAAAPGRREVPSLIPLYDYTTFGTNPNVPSPFAPSTRPPLTGVRPSSHPGSFRPRPSTRGPPPDARYHQRPPISQLPPTLTDEQLALMDSVTREAIDERLRVLEGVSGAVYRCIDDLMRMRSALPVSTPPSSEPAAAASAASTSAESRTSEDTATAAAIPIPDSPTTADAPPEA